MTAYTVIAFIKLTFTVAELEFLKQLIAFSVVCFIFSHSHFKAQFSQFFFCFFMEHTIRLSIIFYRLFLLLSSYLPHNRDMPVVINIAQYADRIAAHASDLKRSQRRVRVKHICKRLVIGVVRVPKRRVVNGIV